LKVLSLFDGLSGAQIALKKLGVTCEYYAIEIDNYAIKIANKNFPETIQLGDVLQFFEKHKTVKDIKKSKLINIDRLPKDIDLFIGGSPCTDLSVAKNNGKGLEGEASKLFWAYLRLLNYYSQTQKKDFYFVLENVESMKTKDFVIITNSLGVKPIMLDAGLVSAQRRKRYFWSNIPGVKKPQDKGLVIADILEPGAQREIVKIDPNRLIKTSYGVRWNGHHKRYGHRLQNCQAMNPDDQKSQTINTNVGKTPPRIIGGNQSQKAVSINNKAFVIDAGLGRKYPYRIVQKNNQPTGRCAQEVTQKSFCVTPGCVSKNHALIVRKNNFSNPQGMCAQSEREKSFSLSSSRTQGKTLIVKDQNHQQDRAFNTQTKHGTLGTTRINSKTNVVFEDLRIEKLTWTEIERLAGLPIGYTDLGKENNRNEHRGRAIGNGFQIDIIVHLLSFMLDRPKPIKRQKTKILGEQQSLF
jgi:site-specific DNA-cytosine methylase